jgi:excinuclease ABC subunit B
MRRAIDETERRRAKQEEFNKTHGIQPVGVQTDVADIMEGARSPDSKGAKSKRSQTGKAKRVQLSDEVFASTEAVEKNIVALEKEMFALAKDLEFEAAAKVRDKIEQLRDQFVRT